MKAPAVPDNETDRVRELDKSGIVYSPAEDRFDRITRLACRIFNVPIALVSIVDADKQWFKSRQGVTSAETPRDISFCGHAILQERTFIIPDALEDPDFADNPMVTNPPFVRFYAGHPLAFGPYKFGTLCIIDQKPRQLDYEEIDILESLARWAENELKLNMYSKAQGDLIRRLKAAQRREMIDPRIGTWNPDGIRALLERDLLKRSASNLVLGIMLIRLYDWKAIEEDLAREQCDELLSGVAQRIRSNIRPSDIIGRLESGDFIVVLDGCDKEDCQHFAVRILQALRSSLYRAGKKEIRVAANIGITSARSSQFNKVEDCIALTGNALESAIAKGANKIFYNMPDKKGGYQVKEF